MSACRATVKLKDLSAGSTDERQYLASIQTRAVVEALTDRIGEFNLISALQSLSGIAVRLSLEAK